MRTAKGWIEDHLWKDPSKGDSHNNFTLDWMWEKAHYMKQVKREGFHWKWS